MTVGTCQNCEYCKTSCEFHCNEIKFAAIETYGTFQEYCVISAIHAHKLPNGIDLAKAAPLHCAVNFFKTIFKANFIFSDIFFSIKNI